MSYPTMGILEGGTGSSCIRRRQLRSAVGTATGLKRDSREAKGALFGGGLRRGLFLLKPNELLNQNKDGKSYNQKADDIIDEQPIVDGDSPGGLSQGRGGIGSRRCALGQDHKEIGEIDPAQQQTDGRHDYVGNQRLNYCAKGRADDNAYGHVYDTSLQSKFFELFKHSCSPE
jgi:hypothetical protein